MRDRYLASSHFALRSMGRWRNWRVNLSDIASWKLHHRRHTPMGVERRNQDLGSKRRRLLKRCCQIVDLVARGLSPVGIWQVTVGDKDQKLAKSGADSNPAKRRTGLADLVSPRRALIGHNPSTPTNPKTPKQ